ncbi:hypothetical protein FA95DRAFT_1578363 [Auriscalpium vulgare]|uniref:Uncharacterized protein n=1 Tax=Auriscalpium vulgare TaxID=40419 RepID=A0ACB8R2M0_9AGAM|nr:hypothetical protein FA95DRAFT_1578363 [Auriscalpium vulgare]
MLVTWHVVRAGGGAEGVARRAGEWRWARLACGDGVVVGPCVSNVACTVRAEGDATRRVGEAARGRGVRAAAWRAVTWRLCVRVEKQRMAGERHGGRGRCHGNAGELAGSGVGGGCSGDGGWGCLESVRGVGAAWGMCGDVAPRGRVDVAAARWRGVFNFKRNLLCAEDTEVTGVVGSEWGVSEGQGEVGGTKYIVGHSDLLICKLA